MAVAPKLTLKQSQSLVMTPQLQQAIKLLQLSNVELATYIEQELERNPLLERDDRSEDHDASYTASSETGEVNSPDTPSHETQSAAENGSEGVSSEAGVDKADGTMMEPVDTLAGAMNDIDTTWGGADSADVEVGASVAFENWGNGNAYKYDDAYDFEANLTSPINLREHLLSQVNITFAVHHEQIVATHLFEYLDESGYFQGNLEEISTQLGYNFEDLEAILECMQHFDPPGIFARNLVECLRIQLHDNQLLDGLMTVILDNLPMVAQGDLGKLARLAQTSEEHIREGILRLKSLQPKPAQAFDHDMTQTLIPDVLLRPSNTGGWIIELNADNIPKVLVNNVYSTRLEKQPMDDKDKEYLTEQLQSANWLVKALHQRATTILKVATAIVQRQEEFFTKGVQYLRPLVLRDIADQVDIHESTVSRVTSNKYIATPRGIYELKYFFTAAISSSDGKSSHSAEAVRFRIKTLIDEEPKNKILSDDTIVKVLRQEGVDIARRTVAKYRESMRIPSSVQRRRIKALQS